jgi:hypothetical protein
VLKSPLQGDVDCVDVGVLSALQVNREVRKGAIAFLAILSECVEDPTIKAIDDLPLSHLSDDITKRFRCILKKHKVIFDNTRPN